MFFCNLSNRLDCFLIYWLEECAEAKDANNVLDVMHDYGFGPQLSKLYEQLTSDIPRKKRRT